MSFFLASLGFGYIRVLKKCGAERKLYQNIKIHLMFNYILPPTPPFKACRYLYTKARPSGEPVGNRHRDMIGLFNTIDWVSEWAMTMSYHESLVIDQSKEK